MDFFLPLHRPDPKERTINIWSLKSQLCFKINTKVKFKVSTMRYWRWQRCMNVFLCCVCTPFRNSNCDWCFHLRLAVTVHWRIAHILGCINTFPDHTSDWLTDVLMEKRGVALKRRISLCLLFDGLRVSHGSSALVSPEVVGGPRLQKGGTWTLKSLCPSGQIQKGSKTTMCVSSSCCVCLQPLTVISTLFTNDSH